MTVKLYVSVCLTAVILSGCQHTPGPKKAETLGAVQARPLPVQESDKDAAALPHEILAPKIDLKHFTAPPLLAGLKYDGEISSHRSRTFLYRNEDRSEELNVAVYGLPGGWDNMSPQRAVAGHYGELRQRRVEKALRNSANALTIVRENLIDLEGHPTAEAQMRWVEGGRPIENQALLLTLQNSTFIRITNASYQQDSRKLLQQTKRALAEFRAAQKASATPRA
ncbi:MAG: hypothetical protein R3292_06065 [Alcanivorax sp.]|nr:hypothetical protein [Alcanivorax sp.]